MASSLGNVLEPEPGDADKRRGPDIRVDIEVPPCALGDPAGYAAPLPHKVPYAGERIERAVVPGEEHLLRLFGEPYATFRRRTPRYVGRAG